jgi:hypothetical protein
MQMEGQKGFFKGVPCKIDCLFRFGVDLPNPLTLSNQSVEGGNKTTEMHQNTSIEGCRSDAPAKTV